MISGEAELADETVRLRGSLIIGDGGTLTVVRSSITFEARERGQYGIFVEPGGRLRLLSSSVASSGERIRFVAQGVELSVVDSRIESVGWCDVSLQKCSLEKDRHRDRGILVETAGARFENSTIASGGIGLLVRGPGATVSRSHIVGNDAAGVMVYADGLRFLGNTVRQPAEGRTGWELGFSLLQVFDSKGHIIDGNQMDVEPFPNPVRSDNWGINLLNVKETTVSNNNVSSQLTFGLANGRNVTIVGNILRGTEGVLGAADSAQIVMKDNVVEGPATALGLTRVQSALLVGNRGYRTDAGDVLSLTDSVDVQVLSNELHGPLPGVEFIREEMCICAILIGTSNSTFVGNLFEGFGHGVVLFGGSDGNTFQRNRIDSLGGMLVAGAQGNVIAENAFVGLRTLPRDAGGNEWNSNGRGNYWSAHTARTPTPTASSTCP